MTFLDQLNDYLNAGFSGIWIQTSEPNEVVQDLIQRQRTTLDWEPLRIWDVAKGLGGIEGQGKGDPLAPLQVLLDARNEKSDHGSEKAVILALLNYHRFLTNPVVVQQLQNLILHGKSARKFVLVLSPVLAIPVELEKLFVVLDHPLPCAESLQRIAAELLADDASDLNSINAGILEAATGLTRYEAEGAFALSLARHNSIEPGVLWELKAQMLKKNGLLELHRGQKRFADLGGMEALKTFCTKALTPRAAGPSARGILLLGVPGTGKSAFAKALGNEVKRPTLTLDIGSCFGALVGETEGKIRQALQTADAMAPAILFVDEIEKALSGIGGNGDSGVSTRLFGTVLTWLNDHASDVFVIATCNDISKLPPEFSRAERWDGVFFLDMPTDVEKNAIWGIYLRQFGQGDNGIQADGNAIPPDKGWTGAEIKSCCRLAALLDVPLADAARHVVPVAQTASDKVAAVRDWASGRCLSAATPGVYQSQGNHAPKTRRAIQR